MEVLANCTLILLLLQSDGGVEYFNTIVVQPHLKLVTNQGRGFHIRCRYTTKDKTISNNVNVRWESAGMNPDLNSGTKGSNPLNLGLTDSIFLTQIRRHVTLSLTDNLYAWWRNAGASRDDLLAPTVQTRSFPVAHTNNKTNFFFS
jgi:hypothetical protein